jgi:ABC-type multidrug transport system ATPase subunit
MQGFHVLRQEHVSTLAHADGVRQIAAWRLGSTNINAFRTELAVLLTKVMGNSRCLSYPHLQQNLAPEGSDSGTKMRDIDLQTPDKPDVLELRSSESLVYVDRVTKSFGYKVALKDVSFSVPPGQICGLLGPNGAGKTTLFRLLMGILKATEGALTINGLDAFVDRVEVKRLIGFLPDEPVFYSYLSGWEVLELSAAMHGLDVAATMDRIAPLRAKLRLSEDINNYAEDYSRGMKKKLGLLLAMLHQPKLLVLDEPTNGLDVESTRLFYDLISETAAQGTTILFSTHLMDHVTRLCSHAVIINEGKIAANGSLQELRASFGQESLEEIFLALTSRPPQR